MALEWKVSENVNAYREISKEEYTHYFKTTNVFELPTYYNDGKYYMMNTECYTLIWLCGITIGIPEITKDNYEQVFNRINLHERLFGSFLHEYNPKNQIKSEHNYTLEMIKNNIGIKTNGIYMNVQEWKDHILKRIVDDTKNY